MTVINRLSAAMMAAAYWQVRRRPRARPSRPCRSIWSSRPTRPASSCPSRSQRMFSTALCSLTREMPANSLRVLFPAPAISNGARC